MSISHLGQPIDNHVTLRGAFGGSLTEDIDFIRVNPDGLLSPFPPYFRVPEGKFLVITDVDWDCTEGDPRTRQTFTISIQNLKSKAGGSRHKVFESNIILDELGSGGISESMTAGFVVSSEGRMIVDLLYKGYIDHHITLRGYLIDDSKSKTQSRVKIKKRRITK